MKLVPNEGQIECGSETPSIKDLGAKACFARTRGHGSGTNPSIRNATTSSLLLKKVQAQIPTARATVRALREAAQRCSIDGLKACFKSCPSVRFQHGLLSLQSRRSRGELLARSRPRIEPKSQRRVNEGDQGSTARHLSSSIWKCEGEGLLLRCWRTLASFRHWPVSLPLSLPEAPSLIILTPIYD